MRHITIKVTILLASLFSSVVMAETFRVMLHTGSFPPYFFEEGDERTGTIKDIFAALAEETGDDFEYVRVPFKRALHKFEVGEIDIEPMTNPLFRGNSKVHGAYSKPFTAAQEVILFAEGEAKTVKSADDLLGHTLGVVNGYYYPEFTPLFESGKITASPEKNENTLIKLLLKGRIQQALINKDFTLYALEEQGLQDKLTVGESFHSLDMMVRLHPNKQDALPRFNQAIEKLLKEGKIEAIYDKYR